MSNRINPSARAVKSFIEKLGKSDAHVGKVIADSFKIKEHSREFYSLIYSEARNFDRLLSQIEMSEISTGARQNYKSQTLQLSTIIRYDVFHQKFLVFKKDVIDPNIVVLTYLDDAIRLSSELGQAEIDEIQKIKEALQEVLAEVLASSLPLYVRGHLREQLEDLIFSLDNFDCVGADIVWQQAAAIFVTAHRDAHVVETPANKQMFGRLGAAMSGLMVILTAFNYGAGQLDSALKHVGSIGHQLKSGYESMESWHSKPIPKIENKVNEIKGDDPV
jgi:hypothetical protein